MARTSKSPSRSSSSPKKTKEPVKHATYLDVYFFVPNLIGYARVILTFAGLYVTLLESEKPVAQRQAQNWILGLSMYTLSFVLDFFDGYAARMFNQSSSFGAVLDMVTDRVSTCMLLVLLCKLRPDDVELFGFLIALDYSSHWVQMYAAKGHHKTTNQDKNIIVRTFYDVYPFFGFCCVGTEIYYVMAVVDYFYDHPYLEYVMYPLMLACLCKNVVNVAQLFSGFEAVAKEDEKAYTKRKR